MGRARLAIAVVLFARAAAATPYEWDLPLGFPLPRVPPDNPITLEKVALGRYLFYDTRLSGNLTQACASCHEQERAFTDGLARGVGSTGEVHPRSSMTLTNVAYAPTLAWANPLLRTLEEQALLPMFGETPVELGLAGRESELFERLRADARYVRMFREAFPEEGDPVSVASITRAIASFVRTLISGNSAYDRWAFGIDEASFSAAAQRGRLLFFGEKFECHHCHSDFNFTVSVSAADRPFEEEAFENTGLYNIDGRGGYPPGNRGLYEITGRPADMGRFKPPTLRNLRYTAPYMHDGSIATLDEVLDHYAAGGRTIYDGPYAGVGSQNPYKNQFVPGFMPTEQERHDVLAFLDSLNDEEFVANPRFADPFHSVRCAGDCNYDGSVAVSELIVSINMALESAPLAACVGVESDADGAVSVGELIRAVSFALAGCPPAPEVSAGR